MPRKSPKTPTQPLPDDLQDYVLDWDAIQLIPETLMSRPDFYEAWELWVAHRAIKQRNPLTKRTARQQLKKLALHVDHADPVEVIDRSISGKWTSVFPENIFSYKDQPQTGGLVL